MNYYRLTQVTKFSDELDDDGNLVPIDTGTAVFRGIDLSSPVWIETDETLDENQLWDEFVSAKKIDKVPETDIFGNTIKVVKLPKA